ncbi:MAG: type II toxin-antitoxin system HicB family antitoxin [bacterium]|nr:type II toxin-antitoxin system HicB family antitoxin [bacterium]
MRKIDLKSVVWKEGKYYVSQCLDVDVSSFGNTKKEALNMLQEALELYFEDMPLPKKSEIKSPTIASVQLHLQHA